MKQFDFGQNWADFSTHALNPTRVGEARRDFDDLFNGLDLTGKSFLDVGFGQGLSLLCAMEKGASVLGCDINPKCGEVLLRNRSFFPGLKMATPAVVTGSILDNQVIENLKTSPVAQEGQYDIVHSWGVLHHTGKMVQAIDNCARLVKNGGLFILAIYNRHWTSPIWTWIKFLYCHSPRFVQRLMIRIFCPIIWWAKRIVTGDDPAKQDRGMDFFYNVIDWVGGYPYEYASIDEMIKILDRLGFDCLKTNKAKVPTGCNEFVFRKRSR